MKDFLKNVLATIVGLFGFLTIMSIFGFISLMGIIASSNSTPSVKDNSVMVMKLQGNISDFTQKDLLGEITGDKVNSMSLANMVSAIKKAKDDEHVKGIYIEAGITLSNTALYQELRNALADFRKSGKWIIAYGDRYSQGAYYVCSVADKIYMNPKGMLDWHGLGTNTSYVKDLYAKMGVKIVVSKVGKFKSFTEKYTEDKMSDANREQIERYMNGTWQIMLADVAKSRGINKDSLNSYADNINVFEDPELLRKQKFIDGFCYGDEIKDIVRKKLGLEDDEKINQISIDGINSAIEDNREGDEIAVYYCQGSIVENAPQGIFAGQGEYIVCQDVIDDLDEIAENEDIKAIVLRINSGGGDAYASEKLWHAIQNINKKKPVVVSMSGMAASGAYYMGMGSRWLVADPTTLTGSIGIFGVFPDFSGLITQKLGIKFDEAKTNRNSNFEGMAYSRPLNAEELTSLQRYIDRGYVLFRKRVADGRKQPVEKIEELAQGRVWLGTDAIKIKLIDQLGNLDDAVKKAAEFAKLKEYHYVVANEETDWITQLNNAGKRKYYIDEQLQLILGSMYEPFMHLRQIDQREILQASYPYDLRN